MFPHTDKILYDEDNNKVYFLPLYISKRYADCLKVSDRLWKGRALGH